MSGSSVLRIGARGSRPFTKGVRRPTEGSDPILSDSGPRRLIDRVFDPRSIAIVGASTDPAKRGHQILRTLTESGYSGDLYPVNPKGGDVLGLPVVERAEQLPEGVDLAVLCTPAAAAPDLVRACGSVGVAGAVVLAVGFGESGDRGISLETELVRAARESGVRVVGPNTSGLMNLGAGINLVGARGVRPGGIALVVQSGNIALALMNEITARTADGVSVYVGIGNQVDIGHADVLDFLEHDEGTRAVVLHAEEVRNARAFLAQAARVVRTKPIVAIKSGRTAEGAAAAASHTGSVAGPYDRLSSALAQVGVVEVTRTDELTHLAHALGSQRPASHGGIAILTDGGGQGSLAIDQIVQGGATVASLTSGTHDQLRALLGPAAAVSNPVDLAGAADSDPSVFGSAMDALASDPAVSVVLVVGLFGGYVRRFADSLAPGELEAAEAMVEAAHRHAVGLVVHSMYSEHASRSLDRLREAHVPVVESLEVATRCALELERRGRRGRTEGLLWTDSPPSDAPVPADIRRALSEDRLTLTEPEARACLESFGVRFTPHRVVTSPEEAADAVAEFGRPCALKVVSIAISHKSDAAGVQLDVGPTAAPEAFQALVTGAQEWGLSRGVEVDPIRALVTPMWPPARAELLVGAFRDSRLGPVVTVGAGGVWVEALRDAAHRVWPVSLDETEAMFRELRIFELLGAQRGRPAVPLEPLARLVISLGTIVHGCEDVAEVELNPVFVYDSGCEPMDARVVLTGRRAG